MQTLNENVTLQTTLLYDSIYFKIYKWKKGVFKKPR